MKDIMEIPFIIFKNQLFLNRKLKKIKKKVKKNPLPIMVIKGL